MSFKLEIKNVGVITQKLKQTEAAVTKVMERKLKTWGIDAVNEAKRRCPTDENFLKNSINFNQPTPMRVELVVGARYAAYVEFGTRRFAADYVNTLPADWQQFAAKFKGKGVGNFDDFVLRLVEWVKRKGLHLNETIKDAQTGEKHYRKARKSTAQKAEDADILAYLIAKKIMREGVHAQPFLKPGVDYATDRLKKSFKEL